MSVLVAVAAAMVVVVIVPVDAGAGAWAISACASRTACWPSAAAPIVDQTASAAERIRRVPMFMTLTLPLPPEVRSVLTCAPAVGMLPAPAGPPWW